MYYFNHYELRPLKNHADEFELIFFIDDLSTEFASELGSQPETKITLIQSAKKLIADQYPGIKVTVVRVMVSGIICATFPIATVMASAQSSNNKEDNVQSINRSVLYKIQPGDTLWVLSQKFNTTIDLIKQANHLSSDTLQLNNQIIIPKAIHTVVAGDYLSTLAMKYGTTSEAIKEANQLSSEKILIGQVLVIPINIHNNIITDLTPSTSNPSSVATTYKVVAGDTLYLIAKKFNTNVNQIKLVNELSSDVIFIGQLLNITSSSQGGNSSANETKAIPDTYKVKPGDTLSGIAKQFNLTINFLMLNNQLTNETILAGHVLHLKENFVKGNRNQIGTVKLLRTIEVYTKNEDGTIKFVRTLPSGGSYNAYSIDYENRLYNVGGNQWLKFSSDILFTRVGESPRSSVIYKPLSSNSSSNLIHIVVSGDNVWNLSVKYGIPQSELLRVNQLNINSTLKIGQKLIIPQYQIAVKATPSSKHGEHLDWWSEAQYVIPIGKTFKVTDFATGKSFMVKRTIGANHADCETVTVRDSTIAKGIWKGYSWTERAVIIEVDGRKIAASMSFMPHDIEYINNNGIRGHFDIHFKNSTRHKDGKIDYDHQKQVNIAAGVKIK
jgi:peptidoglycan DL-endopeptidase LytF